MHGGIAPCIFDIAQTGEDLGVLRAFRIESWLRSRNHFAPVFRARGKTGTQLISETLERDFQRSHQVEQRMPYTVEAVAGRYNILKIFITSSLFDISAASNQPETGEPATGVGSMIG